MTGTKISPNDEILDVTNILIRTMRALAMAVCKRIRSPNLLNEGYQTEHKKVLFFVFIPLFYK